MTSYFAPGSTVSRISRYALPTLTFTLGLQLLHAFVPSMAWYLRDVQSVATFGLVPYAFAPFLLAIFAGFIRRVAGARLSLWITAGGVAVMRFLEQLSRNSGLDLWLSIAGLTLFLIFFPIFIQHARSLGTHTSHRWVYGFVLGLALEIGMRAIYGFRQINSVDGVIPLAIIAVLSLSIFIALWREPFSASKIEAEVRWGSALSLAAFGPLIVIQVLLLGSPGYLSEIANLNAELSFVVIVLGYVIACVGIYLSYMNPHALHPLVALLFAAFLGASSFLGSVSGRLFIFNVLISQGYVGFGLGQIGIANAKGVRRGIFRTNIMCGIGMILFLILVFGFYVAQDVALPFSRSIFPALAGVISGLLILQAAVVVRSKAVTTYGNPSALIAASTLLLIALGYWVFPGEVPASRSSGDRRVRVMTYNIHSGYDVTGQQDLEAIAQVIESSEADVVGLQEVSRTRFMDASADMPYWLARRLNMAVVFHGTEEPIWGNAILSRYPIKEWGWGDLPRVGKLIGRGYLWARIDAGGTEPLLFIVTHLHHLGPDSQARQEQVPVLLEFWNNEPSSIILGDLNAEPGSPEMGLIAEAGFQDAWELAGDGPGLTFSSDKLEKRIDWIWHTSDLSPLMMEVIQAQASDHMPVMTVFDVE